MFKLNIVNDNITLTFMSTSKQNDSILCHARMDHVHFKRMQDMSKDGAFDMDTVQTIENKAKTLASMGIKFKDEIQGLWLLSTLPDTLETFRTSLSNSAPDGVITMKLAKGFLNEEMRRKSPRWIHDSVATCHEATRHNILHLTTPGKRESKLYMTHPKISKSIVNAIDNDDMTELWHKRLGHMSEKGMSILSKKNVLSIVHDINLKKCSYCLARKQTRRAFKSRHSFRTKNIHDLVHFDVCGPMKTKTLGGCSYFVTFIDDHSRKVWVYTLKTKDQVLDVLKQVRSSDELGIDEEQIDEEHGADDVDAQEQPNLDEDVHPELPNIENCPNLKQYLSKSFAMKDLGPAKQILGIRIFRDKALQNDLRKLKGKALDKEAIETHSKDNMEPITPKLLNKRTAHSSYIQHTQEEALVLRDIVEHVKANYPQDSLLESAFRYTKVIQDLLSYISRTCPRINNVDSQIVAVTPRNKDKKVRFAESLTSTENTKIDSTSNLVSNKRVLHSTGACKELLWLKRFLQELGFKQQRYAVLCDNQSTIHLAKNSMFHKRTKHIDIRYHWIRDAIEDGMFELNKVHTDDNASDMLTKAVAREKLKICCSFAGMANSSS
ncbi:retrovirus-related pol polyprotein from transposon TNT 1-94 [Tanacetum coccineum]